MGERHSPGDGTGPDGSISRRGPVWQPRRDRTIARKGSVRLAWGLLATEAVLGVIAFLTQLPWRIVVAVIMATLAMVALVVGVRRHRPTPPTGWWLLLAGVGASLAGVVTLIVLIAMPESPGLGTRLNPLSTGWFTASYLLTIAGLILISRPSRSRAGLVDLLDGAVVAAAILPALWVVAGGPLRQLATVTQFAAIVLAVTLLLVVVLVVKLVLSTGFTWSAGWLLVAMAALVATNLGTIAPSVTDVDLLPPFLAPMLWVIYPVSLGLAAAHPSMVPTTAAAPRPEHQLSIPRTMVVGALALLVPVAFIVQGLLVSDEPAGGDAGAAALVGLIAVALLLVVRLGIAAQVAQRRAAELARQARELDVANREQQVLRQQLTYRALHDPLTGLANRVVLSERLEWVLTRRGGTGEHALLLLDLDGFKDVNDMLGHQVGDELLIAIAHRLLAMVPEGGMLARLGGDEFAVLLEETSVEAAESWAQRALGAIRRPIHAGGRTVDQTVSIGLAPLRSGPGTADSSTALRDAGLALFAAKSAGRDQLRRFAPAMVEARMTHSRLSAGLRRALRDDELDLHYQPIVDLATGQVRAVEALLRWRPPGGEPIPPSEFIPVAEESGLIKEIGAWVLRRACARSHPWHSTRGVAVSVNVSGRQLVEPDFQDTVLEALAAAGLPGEALIVEVTETSMVATATAGEVVRRLQLLRQRGVRVAIDDFGTGYSSMSYLARLPVDILKIDSAFTQRRGRFALGLEEWAFARAIVQLAESLGLATIAEGVETTQEADALRQLHCQLAQGHLFSRAVPPTAVDSLLAMPIASPAA